MGCPICGKGVLRPRLVSEKYVDNHKGVIYQVETKDVPLEACDRCFDSFSGPDAARIRHDSLGRALGLLTPAEITRIRKSTGSTINQFAMKIGVDPIQVTRWERGRLWKDFTADNLIRLIGDDPRLLDRLHGLHQSNRKAVPTALEAIGTTLEDPSHRSPPGRAVELD